MLHIPHCLVATITIWLQVNTSINSHDKSIGYVLYKHLLCLAQVWIFNPVNSLSVKYILKTCENHFLKRPEPAGIDQTAKITYACV